MSIPTHEAVDWRKRLEDLFAFSMDVTIQTYSYGQNGETEVTLAYSSGMTDTKTISDVVLPELQRAFTDSNSRAGGIDPARPANLPLKPFSAYVADGDIFEHLFEGYLVLAFSGMDTLFWMDIGNPPQRTTEETATEISIKGPRDGFTENVMINVALIRKRIRCKTLVCEFMKLGVRTRTKIAVMYIKDIIAPQYPNIVRERLSRINVDGIYSTQQIEELIVDEQRSLMPLLDYTGRPDFVVASLLNGRFVIIVDGNPIVLIGPTSFILQMKSPEDFHFQHAYDSFSRVIRLTSLLVTLILPSAWVSLVAFNQDQLPFRMVATITVARLGLPLPAQMELFLMLVLIEIFREAGMRMPEKIGSTLTVVGGLIIGDAAVRAGLVSPSSVVVGALTAVSSYTLVNQGLNMGVTLIRFALYFISCFFGMYGLIIGFIGFVYYLSRLRSFGLPYLSPYSPPLFSEWKSMLRIPWKHLSKRPKRLHPQDPDRKKEDAT
jgi:hypothetical protein